MTGLEPRADQAVRDAVDAFLEGRLNPEYTGETVFETKNSRYRLMDGILFSAPDPSLIGAELVGWLFETERRSNVESAWQATSRAVLVDRKRGRHIIVTSSTRMLHMEDDAPASGSREDQAGSTDHPPIWEESSAAAAPSLPPPSAPPPPSSGRSRIPACPPLPAMSAQPPLTSRPPAPTTTPATLPRVHAPPRPILQRIPQATAPTPFARPLPYPSAPPRRTSPAPLPSAASAQMGPLPPPGRLPLPPPSPPPYRHAQPLDEGIEAIDFEDEVESTDPHAIPFLLARPAATPSPSSQPPPPSSQPFPLARGMQRGALLR